MLKLLIVDSNAVLAKRIGAKISNHLTESQIDYARNPMILKARLTSNFYDFILADISSMCDPVFTKTLLDKVNCPVIIWSVLNCKECPHRGECDTTCGRDHCPLKVSHKLINKSPDCNVDTIMQVLKDPASGLHNAIPAREILA